ncbi:tRNA (guanine(26)-N(2))-dimethyltransferase [Tanacetum coccineum]
MDGMQIAGSSREILLSDPVSELDGDEDRDVSILHTATFEEFASSIVMYDTIIWVSVSLLLVLAWGVGVILLLYLPMRRYVLSKDLSARELYVTPSEVVYKIPSGSDGTSLEKVGRTSDVKGAVLKCCRNKEQGHQGTKMDNKRYVVCDTLQRVISMDGNTMPQAPIQKLKGLESFGHVSQPNNPPPASSQQSQATWELSTIDNLNSRDIGKQETINNALHVAVNKGHIKMVMLLLETGANVNKADVIGSTPNSLAKQQKKRNIYDMVLSHENRRNEATERGMVNKEPTMASQPLDSINTPAVDTNAQTRIR